MKNIVLAALVLGMCIIIAVSIYVYFSPYQTCVRAAMKDGTTDLHFTQEWCAQKLR